MLESFAIGCLMIVLTTMIHALGMAVALRWLRRLGADFRNTTTIFVRALSIAVLVLVLVLATLIETGVWAALYLILECFSEVEEAVYFSLVTYTTLGFGDVVIEDGWRLLSGIQAANGILMFSWSTALMVVGIHQVSRQLHAFGRHHR